MTSRRRLLQLPVLLLCAALLVACDLPWPLNRLGGGGRPSAGKQEIYVASLIVRNVLRQEEVALAVEPQASTFLEGEVLFFVLNKWSGLAAGAHKEVARVLAADGTELAQEVAQFETLDSDLTATLVEPFRFEQLGPGIYWVVVGVDGVECARYRFEVIAGGG